MDALTLEQTYFVAQILAGVAVVISLLYVGIQLKQNTRAVRLSTMYDVTEQLKDIYTLHAGTKEMSRVFVSGTRGDELNDIDSFRFYASLHTMFRAYENMYYQKISGSLDIRFWVGTLQTMIDLTEYPGFIKYWKDRKHWYSEEFQQHFDNEVLSVASSHPFSWSQTKPEGEV